MREVVGLMVAVARACLVMGTAWLWYTARPAWVPADATHAVDFRRMEEWRKNVGVTKLRVEGCAITAADGRLQACLITNADGRLQARGIPTPDGLFVSGDDTTAEPKRSE